MGTRSGDANFVADVRLDDTDEVLQLPIVKNRLKKLLTNAVKKIALLGNPVIPSSEDTLEQFLTAAGKFFGKDPMEWSQVGEPQVTTSEEAGKVFIKSTGVFSGLELHMFVEPPYYDERLGALDERTPDLNFSAKRVAIITDEQWHEVICDQPWSMSKRRQMLAAFLQAKMEADDGELAQEGCHGLWEMSVNRDNHPDIRIERLMALLLKLDSTNVRVTTMAAAAVWGLATSAGCRRNLADIDAIPVIITNIKRALKIAPFPDPGKGDPPAPESVVTETQRSTLQMHLIGALAMLLVDRCCRRPYIQLEPNFSTLFTLCRNLEGYRPQDAEKRREIAAKILTSLIQRDEEARHSLIMTGSLRSIIELLNPQGPGDHMIQFCMASLLATMVLDDPAMELIRERGEAPLFFEACLKLLTATLFRLHEELDRQLGDYYQSDDEPAVYDLALGVRLAEAAAQAMWGSAYMCLGMTPMQVTMEHVVQLGTIGLDCVETDNLPLSRVCHCVTATLASLASHDDTAQLLLESPDNLALQTLLTLAEVKETENFEQAGHVKSSACAGLAFLAVHPMGAKGDECMTGPHRKALLGMGAFGTLLRAALTSVGNEECDMIVQQAAAIGLMYMSTMAGAIDPAELAMYAALLMDSNNSEMIEFLMAGMWILLRNPENRRVLGSKFNANPANKIAKGMMGKLNDAITLHEINDQAQEKAEMLRGAPPAKPTEEASAPATLAPVPEPKPPPPQQQQQLQPTLAEAWDQPSPSERAAVGRGRRSSLSGARAGADGSMLLDPTGGGTGSSTASLADNNAPPARVSQTGAAVRDHRQISLNGCKGGELAGLQVEVPNEEPAPEAAGDGDGEGAAAAAAAAALSPQPFGEERGLGTPGGNATPTGMMRQQQGSAGGMLDSPMGAMPRGGQGTGRRNRADARSLPPGLADDEREMAKASAGGSAASGQGRAHSQGSFKAGQGQGGAGSTSFARRQAQEAAKGSSKDDDLVKKFDKQLKENWGLETLVSVGESWLPAMMEQDASGQANDVPVLKLFEFLVASICLFMIEEDTVEEPRQLDLFKLSAPPGVRTRTWWTVSAQAPEPQPIVASEQERALGILVKIVGMHLGAAWKSLQLGVLTLWNVCSRNANMERHVVEQGVCAKLLDIMNRGAWPASLRDVAGGCLEFFAERASNLHFFPDVPMPAELDWPLPRQPMQGLVPAIAAYINLINSRIPLLEYRGSHGIARICYAFPYGCADGREFIKEAKNVVAVLGGVDAVVALMKRVNKRYQDIATGRRNPNQKQSTQAAAAAAAGAGGAPAAPNAEDEEAEEFTKDMMTLEAQQDIYFVLFAALLNVSVLRPVQPMVAKKGLLVLLGTNTMLYTRLAGSPQFVVPAGEVEEKLLHLCSSIIQNIAMHPQNRTRMYKAELRGGLALDRLIEDATDGAGLEAELSGISLPPIVRSKTEPSSPTGLHSNSNNRRQSANRANARLSARPAANRPNQPNQLNHQPTTQRAAKSTRISPNGAVLNASVDTATAAQMRPKVLFPTIMEGGQDEQGIRGAGGLAPSGGLPQIKGATSPAPGGRNVYEEDAISRGRYGYDDSDVPSHNSRSRFLSWMENTFMDDGDGNNAQDGNARQRSYRKQMWDENGEWLGNEPESAKALHRILCRPITHLWMEAPEARKRQGKARWEPMVSEYQEAEHDHPLTRTAAKLLATQAPRAELELMKAANDMMATGAHQAGGGGTGVPIGDRPGTQDRMMGRMSLTVLKPNQEVLLEAARKEQEDEEAEQAALHGWRANPAGSSSRGTVRSGAMGASMSMGGGGGEDGEGEEGKKKAVKTVPLKICLGPKRARQVISFEDRIIVNDDSSRPMLTMFEHVAGARVCKDMFPSYQLPNGKQAFMYYNGGTLLDEVHVDAVAPPPRPSTVPAALQQTMPLADVLNLISKPPGSAPPFLPYKPVPYLVPLPERHTLTVKHPHSWAAGAFGDLREDNLQLIIHAKKIIKTQTTTRVEDIEQAKPEHREPWVLPNSIFKPRVKECDSHTFFDTEQTEEKMFERDWQRACAKEKFTGMLCRENKANKSEPKDDKTMLAEVHDVLLRYYRQWYSTFMYYAGGSSGDPYHLSLNAFTSFLDDCQIADSESQYIKRSDCDTIFIVCNFQPDKKSAEAQVNLENAMMRYEFLEALVRAALAKYGKGQATDDVAVAVRMLLEQNVVANIPAGASLVPNEFRQQRLYSEEVDLLLKRHSVLLKAIYSRYRLKPSSGGLRSKVVKLEGWLQLLADAHLVDSQFTISDASLAFLWSRMMTVDEVKDYVKYTCLTFIDFLEALGRTADMKSLPLQSELEAAGYNNILEWSLDKERLEGSDQTHHSNQEVEPDFVSTAFDGGDGGEAGASAAEPSSPTKAGTAGTVRPSASRRVPDHTVGSDLFRTRDSAGFSAPKSRPLYAKLELLLDLMFRRLFWDPAQADVPFNYDSLLRLIKKIDKDLGP